MDTLNTIKIITLVGSRETPPEFLQLMSLFVDKANDYNILFRSGGATGADSVVTQYAKNREIYLPWRGFGSVPADKQGIVPRFTIKHKEMVKQIHPAYDKLTDVTLKFHMRNINQVLGPDVYNPTPSDLLICWTRDGKKVGGTATAITLAENMGIPIINLGNSNDYNKFLEMFFETTP